MNTNGVLDTDIVVPTLTGKVLESVNSFYSLSNGFLVLLVCICIGYALKSIKSFPNGGIPAMVMAVGAIASVFLQPGTPADLSHREWQAKNIIIGIVIGFFAWRLHKAILSKVDDWIFKRFGVKAGDSDPAAFVKPPDNPPPNPPGSYPKP
jgi:cellobiose-specific phosphotransferase system component IIC